MQPNQLTQRTIIFLDIDGVLSVGVRDNGKAPILLSSRNVKAALECVEEDYAMERLRSVAARTIEHGEAEDQKYSSFECNTGELVSDMLVGRLANIIRAAGDRKDVAVVLSSSWRKPRHRANVTQLEQRIGSHLGETFCFDAMTAQCDEATPGDRLRTMGEFLAALQRPKGSSLNVLVLEDFFVNALWGWRCGTRRIPDVAAAEAYLVEQAKTSEMQAEVKLVHTYDEWTTSTGLKVQIGSGLTVEHCNDAVQFLECSIMRSVSSQSTGSPKSDQSNMVESQESTSSKESKRSFGILSVQVLGPAFKVLTSIPWAWLNLPASGKQRPDMI